MRLTRPGVPRRMVSGLVVAVLLQDSGGEPGQAGCVADEEHGAGAVKRRWRQHVVDFKVTVGRELDAGKVRAAFGKGGRGFTNQRGKHTLSGRPPGVIPAT